MDPEHCIFSQLGHTGIPTCWDGNSAPAGFFSHATQYPSVLPAGAFPISKTHGLLTAQELSDTLLHCLPTAHELECHTGLHRLAHLCCGAGPEFLAFRHT